MRPRNPQEKKRASLLHDRRNTYGENHKSSRKNIPRAKRRVNRVGRRDAAQVMAGVKGEISREAADDVSSKIGAYFKRVWKKLADSTLAQTIGYKLAQRVRLGIDDPDSAAARLDVIRRRTRG